MWWVIYRSWVWNKLRKGNLFSYDWILEINYEHLSWYYLSSRGSYFEINLDLGYNWSLEFTDAFLLKGKFFES
jgi:hypothetical protein